MTEKHFADVVEDVANLLQREGTYAVLPVLNARVPHRFTGIYRFDPPQLRNLRLFDRENPDLRVGSDAPMRETYCSIVGEQRQHFATADSRADERLTEHPTRESTLSYCGVLLRSSPDSEPFGTLCHFDLVPRPVPAGEIPLLEIVAPLVLDQLLREQASEQPDPQSRGARPVG